ncbi:MAG: type III-B CRISPR module RAMP protein Cmr1 [Anaerolineae bacterium]|nr:type III-B CRISPR module RAMP protein Cmr1 [Anaerolineae bacterium]
MARQSVTVTLETVTPLFSGGVEPRGQPELRPSAIKGALRVWWRALYGGVHPTLPPYELAAAESRVFGSTDGASPLIIRLSPSDLKATPWQFGQQPGLDYLFFAFRPIKQGPPRSGFATGQSFKVTLQTRPGIAAEREFRQACAALWLWVRLGALGARSRRGAGCLRATKPPEEWPDHLPPLLTAAATLSEWRQETEQGLTQIYTALGWPFPLKEGDFKTPTAFNILHPDAGHIFLLNSKYPSWQTGLNRLGLAYRDFRSRYQPDYQNIKPVVAGRSNQLEPVERAALGLPIIFYYRSLGGSSGTLEAEKSDRRASPLSFHVTRLDNGEYILQLLYFEAQLLPERSGLKLKRQGRPVTGHAPGDRIVWKFLETIRTRPTPQQANDLFVAPLSKVRFPGEEQ